MRRTAAAAGAGESKSTKKPLRDLSSNHLNRSKTLTKMKKKKAVPLQQQVVVVKDEAIDRLLSVHSDLSKALHQVDELVVQAFKAKTTSKQAAKEIESFESVLSDFLSSLQPWVPRIQKGLSGSSLEPENESTQSPATGVKTVKPEGESPKPGEANPLVSSSPLVSWHSAAGIAADESKQLFLLSPLVRPEISITKGQTSQNAVEFEGNIDYTPAVTHPCFPNISALDYDSVRCQLKHQISDSYIDLSPDLPKIDYSLILSTPRLKVSPPKTCVLLEPEYQCSVKNFEVTTPFTIQIKNSTLSESLKPGNSSGKLTGIADVNYPVIVGMNSTSLLRNGRKQVKTSPTWVMSPPKTCTLMELPYEKSIKDASLNCCNPLGFAPPSTNDPADSIVHGDVSRRFMLTEGTPVLKAGDDGAVGTDRHPGENTLKKELWTRFEALSTSVFHPRFSHCQDTDKRFLDRLEEASSINQ